MQFRKPAIISMRANFQSAPNSEIGNVLSGGIGLRGLRDPPGMARRHGLVSPTSDSSVLVCVAPAAYSLAAIPARCLCRRPVVLLASGHDRNRGSSPKAVREQVAFHNPACIRAG